MVVDSEAGGGLGGNSKRPTVPRRHALRRNIFGLV
jgi:hypothetical protein